MIQTEEAMYERNKFWLKIFVLISAFILTCGIIGWALLKSISNEEKGTCLWTDRWTDSDLQCSDNTGILIVGESQTGHGDQIKTAQVFFPTQVNHKKVSVQLFPYKIYHGVTGFVNGRIMSCGGWDGQIKASCYTLNQNAKWSIAPSLLEERYEAAMAIIHEGTGMWILGGHSGVDDYRDKEQNLSTEYMASRTMIYQDNKWQWGPNLTSLRVGACSVTLANEDVIITGGYEYEEDLKLVEKFSLNSLNWTTLPNLQHARTLHSCAHIWLDKDGAIASSADGRSVSSLVVAGGQTIGGGDADKYHPVTSVEMLVGDRWILLQKLPTISRRMSSLSKWMYKKKSFKQVSGTISIPTAMMWLPSHGLLLVGGCYEDHLTSYQHCTNKVWKLHPNGGIAPNFTYQWKMQKKTLNAAFVGGNAALAFPLDFFK